MREMYLQFGKTDKRYNLDDIVRLASKVSGQNLEGFIKGYVQGKGMIDVEPALTGIGLRIDSFVDEFYISPNQNATIAQLAIRRSLLGL